MQKLSFKGLGATNDLKKENKGLKVQVEVLTREVKGLSDEVKDLTKQLTNAHAVESARMDMFLWTP